jgi:hypothetical protein
VPLNLFLYGEPFGPPKNLAEPLRPFFFVEPLCLIIWFKSHISIIFLNSGEPLKNGQGTLVFRGTLVENHWVKLLTYLCALFVHWGVDQVLLTIKCLLNLSWVIWAWVVVRTKPVKNIVKPFHILNSPFSIKFKIRNEF